MTEHEYEYLSRIPDDYQHDVEYFDDPTDETPSVPTISTRPSCKWGLGAVPTTRFGRFYMCLILLVFVVLVLYLVFCMYQYYSSRQQTIHFTIDQVQKFMGETA